MTGPWCHPAFTLQQLSEAPADTVTLNQEENRCMDSRWLLPPTLAGSGPVSGTEVPQQLGLKVEQEGAGVLPEGVLANAARSPPRPAQ